VNRTQRTILFVGTIALIIRGVFPPWKLIFTGGDRAPKDWSEGVAFLFSPPAPNLNAYQYHASLDIRIDWPLLLGMWAFLAITIVLFFLLFTERKYDGGTPFTGRPVWRHLASSFLIALGMPIPLGPGLPVGFLLLMLLRNGVGFEGQGLLFLTIFAFVTLFVGTFIFLTLLRWASRRRVREILVVTVVTAVFLLSIVLPVRSTAKDHKRQALLKKNHDNVVEFIHILNRALFEYEREYGQYPETLTQLEMSAGSGVDRNRAGLVQNPFPHGLQDVYKFRYQRKDIDGLGTSKSYELHVDQKRHDYEDADGVHFFTNESGTIYSCLMCPEANAQDTPEKLPTSTNL
jgi:DNA-dependent RNA polymerase auxiliary subunit epsilon